MPRLRPKRERLSMLRFWSKVDKSGECWNWTAYRNRDGYGRFYLNGSYVNAHRLAWVMHNGSIPDGLTVDHVCRNRACVKLSHLRLLTRGENVLAGTGYSGRNKRKQVCPRGHAYDIVFKNGKRWCRACKREQDAKRYAKNKATINAKRRARYQAALTLAKGE